MTKPFNPIILTPEEFLKKENVVSIVLDNNFAFIAVNGNTEVVIVWENKVRAVHGLQNHTNFKCSQTKQISFTGDINKRTYFEHENLKRDMTKLRLDIGLSMSDPDQLKEWVLYSKVMNKIGNAIAAKVLNIIDNDDNNDDVANKKKNGFEAAILSMFNTKKARLRIREYISVGGIKNVLDFDETDNQGDWNYMKFLMPSSNPEFGVCYNNKSINCENLIDTFFDVQPKFRFNHITTMPQTGVFVKLISVRSSVHKVQSATPKARDALDAYLADLLLGEDSNDNGSENGSSFSY